jgi:spectinomycin phosphotransferase
VLEPPDLSEATMITAVRDHYGIPLESVTFIPLGCDSAAWAFRAETEGGDTYFLKVRKGVPNPVSLIVPHYLHERGVQQVAAPFRTRSQGLWADAGEFALILYPFIDGDSGTERGLNEAQWRAYGAVLRQVHDTTPAPVLTGQMRREAFVPDWAEAARRVDAHVSSQRPADPIEHELAAFWLQRQGEIRALVARATELGDQLRAAGLPFVLCHADVHTWNVMVDTADRLWIVDWDETMLAPKERDLMFVVGGIGAGLVQPHEEAWFLQGYGPASIDPLALAYYRYNWAIGDIGTYAEQVFLMPDTGVITKRNAVQAVISCFGPGNIVDLAYAAGRS